MKEILKTFEGKAIQIVFKDEDLETPYFVLKDLCDVLDLQNPSDLVAKTLEEDEYLTYIVSRSGQNRSMLLVNESGLYSVIFMSRKSIAKKFRKWVTSEVLPAIRKNGGYSSIDIDSIAAEFRMLYERHDKIKAQIKDLEAEKKELEKTIRYKTTNINDIKTAIPYPGQNVDYLIESTFTIKELLK